MILSNNGINGPPRKIPRLDAHALRESPHNEDFLHTMDPTRL